MPQNPTEMHGRPAHLITSYKDLSTPKNSENGRDGLRGDDVRVKGSPCFGGCSERRQIDRRPTLVVVLHTCIYMGVDRGSIWWVIGSITNAFDIRSSTELWRGQRLFCQLRSVNRRTARGASSFWSLAKPTWA